MLLVISVLSLPLIILYKTHTHIHIIIVDHGDGSTCGIGEVPGASDLVWQAAGRGPCGWAMGGAFMDVIRWHGGVFALLSREHLRVPFHCLNSNMCYTMRNMIDESPMSKIAMCIPTYNLSIISI